MTSTALPASPAAPAARVVRFGNRDLPLGGAALTELRDSSGLRGDPAALRARMEEDGCLLIRGLHDPDEVLAARAQMAESLARDGVLEPGAPLQDLVPACGRTGGFYGGADLTKVSAFQHLVSRGKVIGFFEEMLGGAIRTYDYKWLRVVPPGAFTGAHIDVVYMGRGTHELFTCWTPIGDCPLEQGPLAVCVGSHRLPGFQRLRETYGRMDVDRDHVHGWLTDDPLEVIERFGGRWATTEFRAGDALLFGMFTMHGSLTNTSGRLRLSSDTRYQRNDQPVDERWIGENPIAHYGWNKPGENVDMSEMRKRWGI